MISIPFTMIRLIFILLLFSINTIAQTSDEFRALAEEKYEAEDYRYALGLIEKALEVEPMNMDNKLVASRILINLGRPTKAIVHLEEVIQLYPEEVSAYAELGDLYMRMNELENSLSMFDKALELETDETKKFQIYANSATARGFMRDFDRGIEDLEKAYLIDSTDALVINNLAAMQQEIGNKKRGIELLERLIVVEPTFLGSYVNLGLIYSEIDSLDKSEYYFNEGFKIDPLDPLLLNNRGFLYYKRKEYNRALKDINESISLYENNSYAYRNRALVYLALELNKEACRDLEIATYYEFKINYGTEVEELMLEHCK